MAGKRVKRLPNATLVAVVHAFFVVQDVQTTCLAMISHLFVLVEAELADSPSQLILAIRAEAINT
jgi:hypothetical protein